MSLSSPLRGRGATENPPNRFTEIAYAPFEDDAPREALALKTQLFQDTSKTILARNDSPDLGFELSLNPYRGCEHGCAYCYARPTHEFLGLSPGLDFETKIMVKENAPELLRDALAAKSYEPKTIALSGVTDAYQPIERRLRLTRRCLEGSRKHAIPCGS